LGPPLCLWLNG